MLARLTAVLLAHAHEMSHRRRIPDELMRLRLPAGLAADLMLSMEGHRRLLQKVVMTVPEHQAWPDPGARGSLLVVRTFSNRGWRAPLWTGLLAMIEEFVETWDVGDRPAGRRRELFARAGYRCEAPGCTSRASLHGHHVRFRSQGGGEELSNKGVLCAFHHLRGIHDGLASCSGTAPLELTWTLGREGAGGIFSNERRA
jgi:hypothetical protein